MMHLFSAYAGQRWAVSMKVMDEVLMVVAFLGTDVGGSFVPYGTAMVALYEFEENASFPLLVTAAHVIEQIPGNEIVIRMNKRDGSFGTFRERKDRIFVHPEASKDLAVLSFRESDPSYEYRYISLNRDYAARENEIWKLGLGDEVFAVGLYASHYGETKNIPIVRIGNISMMPGEPVLTSAGYTPAFLVEVKSLAGLSGSPVFCNVPRIRAKPGKHEIEILNTENYIPVGIMLGHHILRSKEDQILEPGDAPLHDDRNTGLAVVVPFAAILEILEHGVMQEQFKRSIANRKAYLNYRPDAASLE